jgi:hypothetical protein
MNATNDQPAADYAALRTLADNQAEDIERLLADKARLDWLEQNWLHWPIGRHADTIRDAIDAARKEGQP